uniref:Uncharacterized protein n=1 Tax=Megaselia scalaris TaxID=36166 RepID=T1H2Y0_MEGSC
MSAFAVFDALQKLNLTSDSFFVHETSRSSSSVFYIYHTTSLVSSGGIWDLIKDEILVLASKILYAVNIWKRYQSGQKLDSDCEQDVSPDVCKTLFQT